MNLIEVVILVGSQCLSPIELGAGTTEAAKVQCAVLVRQDPDTEAVEIVPPAAATDPEVIAMLVRPDRGVADAAGDAEKTSLRPVSEVEDGRGAPVSTGTLSGKKMQERNPATVVSSGKKRTSARRSDVCGSYRPVWYTNKYGRRKYRCVRAG